jgi:hypothetical protein
MKVAMMQPTFLPWQGYFELLDSCDTFIFEDDFQFSTHSYQQRNRFFVKKLQPDWDWATVPVIKGSSLQPLNKTLVNYSLPWREKLWRKIENSYLKTDYFSEIGPQVRSWLFLTTENLAELNIGFIKLACQMMDIHPKFLYSSQMPLQSKRSQLVLDLLRKSGATQYLCARGAFGYMYEDKKFPVEDIEVVFQNYNILPYKQIGAGDLFIPNLSILDALFNIGPTSTLALIRKGKSQWCAWSDMVRNEVPILSSGRRTYES